MSAKLPSVKNPHIDYVAYRLQFAFPKLYELAQDENSKELAVIFLSQQSEFRESQCKMIVDEWRKPYAELDVIAGKELIIPLGHLHEINRNGYRPFSFHIEYRNGINFTRFEYTSMLEMLADGFKFKKWVDKYNERLDSVSYELQRAYATSYGVTNMANGIWLVKSLRDIYITGDLINLNNL